MGLINIIVVFGSEFFEILDADREFFHGYRFRTRKRKPFFIQDKNRSPLEAEKDFLVLYFFSIEFLKKS